MTLSALIQQFIDSEVLSLNTCRVGRIVRYEHAPPAPPMVDVQPLIKDEEGRTLPILVRIPIVYPQGGGYAITFPVVVGDNVLVVFAQESMDEWQEYGGVQQPQDLRRMDLSDGFAIPGIIPNNGSLPSATSDALVIGETGTGELQIRVKGGKVKIGDGTTEVLEAIVDFMQLMHDAKYIGVAPDIIMDTATQALVASAKAALDLIRLP